jgi:hypothetical protein
MIIPAVCPKHFHIFLSERFALKKTKNLLALAFTFRMLYNVAIRKISLNCFVTVSSHNMGSIKNNTGNYPHPKIPLIKNKIPALFTGFEISGSILRISKFISSLLAQGYGWMICCLLFLLQK